MGVGAGNGKIKWSLPDAHTDFIIAVAIEEFGLIVFFLILTLFLIILFRTLSRLIIERNPFLLLVGLGLLTIIQAQALINLGVAASLLPTKGMTLPFISYGGSSMVAMGILMGLLLNVTRRRTSGNIDTFMGGHLMNKKGVFYYRQEVQEVTCCPVLLWQMILMTSDGRL